VNNKIKTILAYSGKYEKNISRKGAKDAEERKKKLEARNKNHE
jgi:hypothetical protein